MQDWKALMKRMKLEHIKEKSPGFFALSGSYKLKVNAYSDQSTSGLTNCVTDFLKFNRIYCNRVNTMGTPRMIDGKMKFTHSTTRKGTFDLDIVLPPMGRSCKLEIKCGTTKDRLSDAQKAEIERLEAAGALWFIVTDFPSFLKWFEQTTGITSHWQLLQTQPADEY